MPLFSVIIPAYNRFESLKKAVESVKGQSLTDHEIIVVDDGSTDDTPLIKEIYPDIRYIHRENRGVSSARNTGIRESSAEWIAFLDSDDTWLPGKLETQLTFIREHPGIRLHQTEEIWIRGGVRVNPGRKHKKTGGYIFRESLELCLISPSAVVMHRSLFEQYGMFDERLMACEDYDLWLRITPFEEAGLIPEYHVIRNGGHDSQLSAKYPMMDAFRVYSILKLLREKKGVMKKGDIKAAGETALSKIKILTQGAAKRGRTEESGLWLETAGLIKNGSYNSINDQTLEKISTLPLIERHRMCQGETIP